MKREPEKNVKETPQLWTSISHEIRTPLNVIMGMTDISEGEIYDIEQMKKYFYRIKESAQNMLQVVDALVDYAEISQDSIKMNNSKFDFKNLITNIAMNAYSLAQGKNCHFNIHVKEVSEELLIGDEARVSQILSGLLKLVIQYTEEEGCIDFTVKQASISGGRVFMRFVFRSTALMFPEETVTYLNHNSEYMKAEVLSPVGTFGLAEMNALYIAYLMGGKIKASNVPGDYSEIILDLDFEQLDAKKSLENVRLFSKHRILIVADTEESCHERGRMLLDMGMKYDIAISYEAALNKIGEAENDRKPFSICIIDWCMQKMKSEELIREIRKIFGQKLVILAAAHNPKEYAKKAMHYGINYVIDRTIFRSTLFDAMVSIEKGVQNRRKEDHQEKPKYNFMGKRALVAEDVALNMEVITKLLSRVNISVTCVENGVEAITQFEQKPEGYYDIILMDINMPLMDGYEAARLIRESKKADAKEIRIYAMTANAFKEDVEAALEAGMDGHIAKPVDVKALYQLLANVLLKEENELDRTLREQTRQLEKENKELKDWAEHDPLTGCLNRHGLDLCLEKIEKEKQQLAYMIVDLDNFKGINDRFGHEVGDRILIKITKLLKKKFRQSDYFVRMGGDEFVVLLRGFKNENAFILYRIEEINDELLHPIDDLPPITISVGVAISADGYTKDLYANADKALYQIKKNGKNGCTIYSENVEEKPSVAERQKLYGEGLYYVNPNYKVMVEKKQMLQSLLLTKNKPVAFITGFAGEDLPVYSLSGFMLEHLGYTFEEFQLASLDGFASFVHPDNVKYLLENEKSNEVINSKIRIRHKNGDYIWFNMEYIWTKTLDGIPFWMASMRSIDDNLVGALCVENYRMVAIINPETDSVIIEKGAHISAEHELHIQKKYNYSSLIDYEIQNTIRECERESYIEKASIENICEKIKAYGLYEFIVYQTWNEVDYHAVRHKYRFLSDRDNTILCTWEILDQWAETDELTDVMNEKGFYRVAARIMEEGKEDSEYSILYFDISGFKAWNSMLGKDGADCLLKIAARFISEAEVEPLAVGRLFSDHFICLIQKEKLDFDIINSLCNNYVELDENVIPLRMRCGIFNVSNKKETIRSMCDRAKLAESFVENERAIPYYVFDDSMNTKYMQQMHVLNNLGSALERDEMKVFYQPIVDAKTKKIASAEALIRWILPGNYVLSPAIFIPALEERGHIADVDSFAQQVVCNLLERRHQNGQHIVPVSVNMSRMDFLNTEFVEKLKTLVTANEIVREYFRLEVTESSCIQVGDSGTELMKYLKRKGIKVLMDDFGTGYSSLSGLSNQSFDILKLDMSFIRNIGKKHSSEAIIKSVIVTCHHLGLKVVAEGVETEEQYQFLLDADCDYIQGYYFYKPIPEEEFEKLLNE